MTVLSHEMLEDLLEEWRKVGAVSSFTLQPPATTSQLELAESALGWPLPKELRTLYSWHNGAVRLRVGSGAAIYSVYDFTPLDQAVEVQVELRGDVGFVDRPRDRWFPVIVAGHGDLIVADCGDDETIAPAFYIGSSELDLGGLGRQSASLGSMVQSWLVLHREGGYTYDRDAQRWTTKSDVARNLAGTNIW